MLLKAIKQDAELLLKIIQTNNSYNFEFKKGTPIKKLTLKANDGTTFYVKHKKNSKNTFEVKFADIFEKFCKTTKHDIKKIHILATTVKDDNEVNETLDRNFLDALKLENIEKVNSDSKEILLYLSKKRAICISIDMQINNKVYIQKQSFNGLSQVSNKKMKIDTRLLTNCVKIESVKVLIKNRTTHSENELAEVEIVEVKGGFKSNYTYDMSYEITPTNLCVDVSKGDDQILDLFYIVKLEGINEPLRVRCGHESNSIDPRDQQYIKKESDSTYTIVVPYLSYKGHNLSYAVARISKPSYLAYKAVLEDKKLLNRHRNDIWLIGEWPYKAQDNGLHFFKYMRKTYPEKEVYYVIDFTSPEYENLKGLGNIIDWQSVEHFRIAASANYICTTHTPEVILPIRYKKYLDKIKAKRIFLQHGILGTKNIQPFNGQYVSEFETDVFIVSSEREKQIVVNDLLWPPDKVFVTGLPRFDRLFLNDAQKKQQILIIPTWRDWIMHKDSFKNSEYSARWSELLNSKTLKKMHDQGVSIVFMLHPNMQKFRNLIEAPGFVQIVKQGQIDVQTLMKESAMMVTDYSSVSLDFALQHRPVLYYQFDRKRYLGSLKSHMQIDYQLPGRIEFSFQGLCDSLNHYRNTNFKQEDEYKNRSDKFLFKRDQNNSERVYEAAIRESLKSKIRIKLEEIYHSRKYQKIFNIFRKSKYYYPAMKIYYSLARLTLTRDDSMILFESGVGKQVNDSPRAIYDSLQKKNSPYKYIFVYNKSFAQLDGINTRVVKRLSPSYFYYLAKAKFWVNNQQFPTYIKKPKETIFIQTWHGTPLKKMQNDIVVDIKGRSDDYLDRVNGAVKNWDFLLSSSKYTTQKFRSAFRYDGEILEYGLPRNDLLYDTESAKEIRRFTRAELGIPREAQVILYAPTFRDDSKNSKGKFESKIKIDFKKFVEEMPNEAILMIRAHVIDSAKIKIPVELRDRIINVSEHNEIAELYLAADVLITDYSSVMFDFANTNKPIILYTYDYDHYEKNLRGFYFELKREAPGPVVETEDELYRSLVKIDDVKKEYQSKYRKFKEKFIEFEKGTATEKIVEKIWGAK